MNEPRTVKSNTCKNTRNVYDTSDNGTANKPRKVRLNFNVITESLLVDKLQTKSMPRMNFKAEDVDPSFYYAEQKAILENHLRTAVKNRRGEIITLSEDYIRNTLMRLHAIINKYHVAKPTEDAVVELFKQIEVEARVRIAEGGENVNPEGLKMTYFYPLKHWADALGMPSLKPRGFRVPAKVIRPPSGDDVMRMINAAHPDARAKAIIALAAASGVRRKELRHIKVGDLHPELKGLYVRDHGQGIKTRAERFVPFLPAYIPYIQLWLGKRAKQLADAGIDSEWLFITEYGTQMSDALIYQVVGEVKNKAGIKYRGNVHGMRRYMITTYTTKNDMDIGRVAKAAGHTNVATTARYQYNSDDDLIDMANRVKKY